MKERPILFSAPMVRAILEDRKTMTRRVVKRTDSGRVKAVGSARNWHLDDPNALLACPYGQPGNRLWVREAFAAFVPLPDVQYYKTGIRKFEPINGGGFSAAREVVYRADGDDVTRPHPFNATSRWKPSIHMPRWASRLTLEITEIRVERLKSMSALDAIAEGIEPFRQDLGGAMVTTFRDYLTGETDRAAYQSFQTLWQSINGPDSWEANPWVWVVSFRRVEEGGAA